MSRRRSAVYLRPLSRRQTDQVRAGPPHWQPPHPPFLTLDEKLKRRQKQSRFLLSCDDYGDLTIVP